MQPGASIDIADAALVTEDNLAARKDPVFLTRLPATASACGRVMAEAVAPNQGEAVGVRAQTHPTQPRPGPFDQVAERQVTFDGQASRAVVGHASSPEQRRQTPLERARQASSTTLVATVRAAAQQEDGCQAEAAAAAKRRALSSTDHQVAGGVAARPTDGPGRPSVQKPRAVHAWR